MSSRLRSSYTLGDAGVAIVRRWRGIALITLSMLVLGALFTLSQTPKYRSEGKLYVRLGRENAMLDPTATLGSQSVVAVPLTRTDEINSVVEVLSSDAIVDGAVGKVGPEVILADGEEEAEASKDPVVSAGSPIRSVKRWLAGFAMFRGLGTLVELTPTEEARREFQQRFEVTAVKNSNVIRVLYDGQTPEISQKAVAAMLDVYQQEHARMNRSTGGYNFLADQAKHEREELEALQNKLVALRNETGLVSLTEQRKQIIDRVGRLQDALVDRSTALAASEARVEDLRRALKELPEMEVVNATKGYGNDGTDDMRSQFFALQLKLQELEARYSPVHPQVIQLRQQVADAKLALEQEDTDRTQTTEARSQTFEKVRLDLLAEEPHFKALRAEANELKVQLADLRGSLDKMNADDLRVSALEREVAIREASYKGYAESMEKTRVDEALEKERISNISVVQPATLDRKPFSPRISLNMAFSLFLGLVLGTFWALAREYFDDSLRGPADLEHELGVPVFASIPRLRRKEMVIHGNH